MQIKTTKSAITLEKKKNSTNLIVPKTDEVVELSKDYQMLLRGMQTSIINFEKKFSKIQ